MVFGHDSYRSYLKAVLAERMLRNPAYSQRAYARSLGLAASSLADILQGKKNLSSERAPEIGRRLGLKSELEREYFSLLVLRDNSESEELREQLRRALSYLRPAPRAKEVEVRSFRGVSDWHYMAILDLAHIEDGRLDPDRVAQRLGLTRTQAKRAIDRLLRLGWLRFDERGRLHKSSPHLHVQSAENAAELKRFHTQILRKAIQSLKDQSPSERITGTTLLAFDLEDLPEVERLGRGFFERVIDLASKSSARNEIYTLSLNFFRLTSKPLL